jgi:hypothetical protein
VLCTMRRGAKPSRLRSIPRSFCGRDRLMIARRSSRDQSARCGWVPPELSFIQVPKLDISSCSRRAFGREWRTVSVLGMSLRRAVQGKSATKRQLRFNRSSVNFLKLVSRLKDHFLGYHTKTRQLSRSKRGRDRHVGGVTSPRNRNTADARVIVTRIKAVPAAA